MARITVEDCIDKFESRFELVLVASNRARKLHSGDEPTVQKDNDKNTVIALREIADSSLTVDQMKENLIQEYQTVTINDEEDENFEIQSIEENSEESSDSDMDGDSENIESQSSDTSKEVEEEISNLVSSEDNEIQEQYEITEVSSDDGSSLSQQDHIDESNQEEELDKETI